VYLGDCNNDRQPEVAKQTGNTYGSGSIEIPTAIWGLRRYDHVELVKSVGK